MCSEPWFWSSGCKINGEGSGKTLHQHPGSSLFASNWRQGEKMRTQECREGGGLDRMITQKPPLPTSVQLTWNRQSEEKCILHGQWDPTVFLRNHLEWFLFAEGSLCHWAPDAQAKIKILFLISHFRNLLSDYFSTVWPSQLLTLQLPHKHHEVDAERFTQQPPGLGHLYRTGTVSYVWPSMATPFLFLSSPMA